VPVDGLHAAVAAVPLGPVAPSQPLRRLRSEALTRWPRSSRSPDQVATVA
jgi:hypothetical protein